MTALEIHYAVDGWAALYVDGKLDPDSVGDPYLAEERAFALAGIDAVHDDAFLRGQSQRNGVAPTLEDVVMYRNERTARRTRAAELRAEAERLAAEARELES